MRCEFVFNPRISIGFYRSSIHLINVVTTRRNWIISCFHYINLEVAQKYYIVRVWSNHLSICLSKFSVRRSPCTRAEESTKRACLLFYSLTFDLLAEDRLSNTRELDLWSTMWERQKFTGRIHNAHFPHVEGNKQTIIFYVNPPTPTNTTSIICMATDSTHTDKDRHTHRQNCLTKTFFRKSHKNHVNSSRRLSTQGGRGGGWKAHSWTLHPSTLAGRVMSECRWQRLAKTDNATRGTKSVVFVKVIRRTRRPHSWVPGRQCSLQNAALGIFFGALWRRISYNFDLLGRIVWLCHTTLSLCSGLS